MKLFHRLLNEIVVPLCLILELILVIIFTGCFSSELRLSEYKFRYNNNDYVIRSAYCPGNPESCNQIIGESLMAVDLDQDRIIDKVSKGNISIPQAQLIYDYCLTVLERENKLSTVNSANNTYRLIESDFHYEIKSFQPLLEQPFNKFTVIDKKYNMGLSKKFLFIDDHADGILDEVVKSDISLKDAQILYDKVIAKGLADRDLVKSGSFILVN